MPLTSVPPNLDLRQRTLSPDRNQGCGSVRVDCKWRANYGVFNLLVHWSLMKARLASSFRRYCAAQRLWILHQDCSCSCYRLLWSQMMKCGCYIVFWFVVASKYQHWAQWVWLPNGVHALQTPASSWLGLCLSGEHLDALLGVPFTSTDHQGWSARRSWITPTQQFLRVAVSHFHSLTWMEDNGDSYSNMVGEHALFFHDSLQSSADFFWHRFQVFRRSSRPRVIGKIILLHFKKQQR